MCLRDVQGVRENVQATALQHVIVPVRAIVAELAEEDAVNLADKLAKVQVDIK